MTTVREVIASRVIEPLDAAASSAAWPLNLPPLASGRLIGYEITGTGFLRHMVRKIVGTLVDIGRARRPIDDIAAHPRLTRSQPRRRHRAAAWTGAVVGDGRGRVGQVRQVGRVGLKKFKVCTLNLAL